LPVSQALHRILIAPVRDAGLLDGAAHLVIVPQGALGQLPFAALQDSVSMRYLAEEFSVGYLPSAAALPAIRDAVPRNVWYETKGEVFAPFPLDLPSTAREAEAFEELMPQSRARLDDAATEASLRLALGTRQPVHVATHGTLNARNPMFSRVDLARPRSRTTRSDDDGRLEVHELIGLVVRSPLVFFSGCETGAEQPWIDDPVRGSAEHTLAQATLSAGASNVISTLWRIDDAAAAEFARRFYGHLSREFVSSALALAQQEMTTHPTYASPYYWAAYTLSGEGRFGGSQTSVPPSVPF
jgi:CHAT domain-containing protein